VVDSELLVGLISGGSALGGALIGGGFAVLAARSQRRATAYQANSAWLRETLPPLYVEFGHEADVIGDGISAALGACRRQEWDEAERLTSDVVGGLRGLRRSFTVLMVNAPQYVLDDAEKLFRCVVEGAALLPPYVAGRPTADAAETAGEGWESWRSWCSNDFWSAASAVDWLGPVKVSFRDRLREWRVRRVRGS
uniref:hypothetical protein n=1 Tax=Streptomyces atriruber TaxID=545121 RepID=UPI0012FEAA95